MSTTKDAASANSFDRRTVVFTNGVFDIIHPGHVEIFRRCRELAGDDGCVVVAINDDASVRRLKGECRPVVCEKDRVDVVSGMANIDVVMLFREDTPQKLIESIRPDYIVKGGDYKLEDVVGHELAKVVIVPLDGHSTTAIIEKISGPCKARRT